MSCCKYWLDFDKPLHIEKQGMVHICFSGDQVHIHTQITPCDCEIRDTEATLFSSIQCMKKCIKKSHDATANTDFSLLISKGMFT